MIKISEFGWKIRIYKAATIIGKNIGIRDRYDYTPAMLHHSLLTRWLQANGMQTDKNDESTRDIICIDFQFGLRSYAEEIAHMKELRKKTEKEEDEEKKVEQLKIVDDLEAKINARKDLYQKMSKNEVRTYLYVNGADIAYPIFNKKSEVIGEETIHYKMFYRNPSKAKQGSCMFIREELYDKAYEWITMGIGLRLPQHNAMIVEMSAYAPLVASAIEGTLQIPVDDVLILEDQDSYFRTIADVIRTEDYQVTENVYDEELKKKVPTLVTKKKCVVHREETDVKNTLWDGEALIETSVVPDIYNGMVLLRGHFFKACAFRTRIQKFFQDYCAEHDIDYETYEIRDMFGNMHLAKNVKMITTDNACKWLKFRDLIGGDKPSAYQYWRQRMLDNDSIWGVVKTSHPSKYGDLQRGSYQIYNTIPCTKEDMSKICQTSVGYIESLKKDNEKFVKFLQENANFVNSYSMLADLYNWNPEFANSKYFRFQKKIVINEYVNRMRKGKLLLPGDNLTVCGNPYALLLHTVGENWEEDPTLKPEDGTIQVYTKRFEDSEYLCGIRSPHNGSSNIAYFHNIKHPFMDKYFDFCSNIMAVNCIHTDLQCRMNGEDWIH